MVLFNYSTKELTAKVVYYGAGLCGKTTNLQWIHEKLPIKNKGKMLSLATETDRTLFFDFLPIELGSIRGMKTRIQLYTVPGQVFYNATRRMVLKGADCVVFVCDSQEAMLDANLESFENLRQNLEANEIDADEIPMVIQYNKRDLPNALPVEILNERLNPRGLPFYEAVAVKGQGVEETLKGVTATVFRSLATRYGGASAAPAARPAPIAPAPVAAAPVVSPAPPAPARAAAPMAAAAVAAAPAAGASADALLDSLEIAPPSEVMPELGGEELSMSVGAEPEEIELEELSAEPYAASPGRESAVRSGEPELSLEAIDEEVVEEDELGPAPSFGALDE
jgi:mutual gliding-motility protein MglA